jgi:hypothetical protein
MYRPGLAGADWGSVLGWEEPGGATPPFWIYHMPRRVVN